MQKVKTGVPIEMLERYCRNHRISFIASLLLCTMLAMALWEHVAAVNLLSWLALVLLTQAAQAWYSHRYLREQGVLKYGAANWVPGLLWASVATGAAWGVSFFMLGLSGGEPVALLLIFSIAGVTAYAAIAKSDILILGMSFEIAALLPLSAWLFIHADALSHAQYMGFIALLYLVLMYFLLRQINAMALGAHTLRHENSELNEVLARVRQLKRESAMFTSMFEMISDPAIAVHDPDDGMRIVYANAAACRHFGVDEETVLTLRPRDFDVRIDDEKSALVQERLEQHGRFAFQSVHRRADGEEVPVEVVINTFEHEGGLLRVSFVRNISARLEAEQRMRELELATVRQEGDQRIGRYLECVPGLFFTLRRDRDGNLSMPFARGSSASFQGLSPETVAESIEPLLALCHPDDTAPLLAELHASALSLRPCHAEFRIGDPTVGVMTMELTAQPQPSADDAEVMEWHGFMQDITARKLMEQALHESEDKHRTVFESANDGIFLHRIVERDGNTEFVLHDLNQKGCELWGQSREDILSGNFDLLAMNNPPYSFEEATRRNLLAAAGEPQLFDWEIRRGDGSKIWSEVNLRRIEIGGESFLLATMRDLSERKRLEVAVRENEARYRQIFDNTQDGVFMLDVTPDRRFRVVEANPAFERLIGIARADMIDRFVDEVLLPETAQKVSEKYNRCLDAGTIYREEQELVLPVGRHTYHTTMVPVRDDKGQICRVVGMVSDITERKLVEAALRERGELLNAIVESSPEVIVFALDTDYRYLSFNSKHQQVMQAIWGKEIRVGKSMLEVFGDHPDREVSKHSIDRALSGESFVEENAYGDEALSREYWQTFWSPIRAGTGEVTGLTCFVLNISERKQIELVLAARERDFRSLAENIPDNIARFDTEGRYLYVNPTHERMLGMPMQALIGQPVPESHEQVRAAIAQCAASGQAVSVEQRVPVNGEIEVHSVCFAPEFDEDGKVVSVLGIGHNLTHIFRLQETIAAREAEFRSLAENSPDPIFRYDRDCRCIYANAAVARLTGVQREALLGKSPAEFVPVPAVDAIRAQQVIQSVLDSGKSAEMEMTFTAAHGKEVSIHNVFVPEFDADGVVQSVLCLGRDITERKRAEIELQKRLDTIAELNLHLEENACTLEEQTVELEASQEQLKDALEFTEGVINAIPDILFELDGDGRYLNVWTQNPTVLAAQRAALLGKTVHEILSPESAELAMAAIREAEKNGFAYEHTLPIMQLNGETRWYEHSLAKKYSGGAITYIALSRDVTERMRSAKLLDDTRKRLQSVLQTIPDLVWMKDAEGKYLLCNPAFERFFGATEVDIVGKTDYDFVDTELADFFREKDLAAIKAEATHVNEEWVTFASDGQRRLLETRKVPVKAANGSVIGVLGVGHDITARQKMEVARENSLAEALRLAQMRSVFMAHMSHELRTPLNGILGHAQNLLHGDALKEKQADGLKIIQHSGEHLLSLINGLLDQAAIEADKFELIVGDIPLESFLGTVIGIIRIRAEQKNVAFSFAGGDALPAVVRGDAQRLRQILLNLLSNAVKFTDRGQVTLRLEYSASRMYFEVSDSGVGIAADQLEKIFLPFEQTGDIGRRAGGTGLGLAISRKLVQLMGGDIKVESRLGAGSTFSFEIGMPSVQSDASKFEAASLAGQAATAANRLSATLEAPPREELDVLHKLAQRGNMRDIASQAARLAEADARYQPFVGQLLQLAKNFQTRALLRLIEQYREERTSNDEQ